MLELSKSSLNAYSLINLTFTVYIANCEVSLCLHEGALTACIETVPAKTLIDSNPFNSTSNMDMLHTCKQMDRKARRKDIYILL